MNLVLFVSSRVSAGASWNLTKTEQLLNNNLTYASYQLFWACVRISFKCENIEQVWHFILVLLLSFYAANNLLFFIIVVHHRLILICKMGSSEAPMSNPDAEKLYPVPSGNGKAHIASLDQYKKVCMRVQFLFELWLIYAFLDVAREHWWPWRVLGKGKFLQPHRPHLITFLLDGQRDLRLVFAFHYRSCRVSLHCFTTRFSTPHAHAQLWLCVNVQLSFSLRLTPRTHHTLIIGLTPSLIQSRTLSCARTLSPFSLCLLPPSLISVSVGTLWTVPLRGSWTGRWMWATTVLIDMCLARRTTRQIR